MNEFEWSCMPSMNPTMNPNINMYMNPCINPCMYPYVQMMDMSDCCYPMMTMAEKQLESMYPKVYIIVHPAVQHHCDMMDAKFGMMHIPSREELDSLADGIVKIVSPDVEVIITQSEREEERQLGLGGRRLLRDLVSILLLRELIRRRRPFFGFGRYNGYPGVGGYSGYSGEYPIY